LSLKLRYSLVEKGMSDTSRTVKRLCAVLIRKPKERKPLLIRLLPILAGRSRAELVGRLVAGELFLLWIERNLLSAS